MLDFATGRRDLPALRRTLWTRFTVRLDVDSVESGGRFLVSGWLARGDSRDGVGGGILVVDYQVHARCIDRGLHTSQDRIWQHRRNRRGGPRPCSARHSPPQRQALVFHIGQPPRGSQNFDAIPRKQGHHKINNYSSLIAYLDI